MADRTRLFVEVQGRLKAELDLARGAYAHDHQAEAAERLWKAYNLLDGLAELVGGRRALPSRPPGVLQRPCRYCSAPIVFLRDAQGRAVPVDVEEAQGQATFDPSVLRSHNARCPGVRRHDDGDSLF